MSTLKSCGVSQAARQKMAMTASTVREASTIGKCLTFCDSLGINEFSFKGLSWVMDMRPTLGSGECMITRITNPESFLVVRRKGSYMSPLVEINDELFWAFEDKAAHFTENPEIMDSTKVHIFSTREGD